MMRVLALTCVLAPAAGFMVGAPAGGRLAGPLHRQSHRAPLRRPTTAVAATEAQAVPGSADLDWPNLGFEFRKTNAHVKYTWKEGEGWNSGELVSEDYVQVSE